MKSINGTFHGKVIEFSFHHTAKTCFEALAAS